MEERHRRHPVVTRVPSTGGRRGVTRANSLIVLLHLGGLSLAAGVVSLGIGLLKPADKLAPTGS